MVQYVRMYGGLAVLLGGVALIAVIAVLVGAALAARRGRSFRLTAVRGVLWVLAGACACATAALTLVPMAGSGRSIHLVPFETSIEMLRHPNPTTFLQFAGNVLLLSWIGLLLPALIDRATSVATITAIGAATSMAIEALQYVTNSGRATTVDDVILNTVGVFIGAAIGVRWAAPRLRRLAEAEAEASRRG